MTSYQIENCDDDVFLLPENEAAAAEFIGEVGRAFQDAFARRKKEYKLTQQQLADRLGVDRSRIHRCLSGSTNLTAESMAELAWALGAKPIFTLELDDPHQSSGSNHWLTSLNVLQNVAVSVVGTGNTVRVRSVNTVDTSGLPTPRSNPPIDNVTIHGVPTHELRYENT